MTSEDRPTIVLIHGLWMTPLSWENWASRFSDQGYNVVAPAWPGMEGDIDAFRKDPSAVGKLSISDLVEHYQGIIEQMEHPPIIMGHSFGGLITQLLIDRNLGSAGVAISTAPVRGILLLPFSTLRVTFPALSNPFNFHAVQALSEEQFHYAFGNLLSEEESRKAYERYAVPGPDHVLFQAGLANFNPHAETAVNFKNNDRAPLLFITGDMDHIAPASLVETNYNLYKNSQAVTALKIFEKHSHYILGEAGWEEIADFALTWATSH